MDSNDFRYTTRMAYTPTTNAAWTAAIGLLLLAVLTVGILWGMQ